MKEFLTNKFKNEFETQITISMVNQSIAKTLVLRYN